MENPNDNSSQVLRFKFNGNGSTFFGILFVNFILTALTLGLYHPWAKAAKFKYLYQEAELEGSPFTFHGTGKELFIGMLKAIGIITLMLSVLLVGVATQNQTMIIAGSGIYLSGLITLLPFAIVSSIRYRLSRSSWRGIHFGYRGKKSDFLKKFISGFLLTVITFGIYGSWFTISLYKEVIGNVRFGNLKMKFTGKGSDYFVMNLAGIFLSVFTLGIYYFWWKAKVHNYIFNNIEIEQEEEVSKFKSIVNGGDFLGLSIVNILMIVFSFGLAYPWVILRTARFYFENVAIVGELDLNRIVQTEEIYENATGEGIMDGMDLQLI